MSPFDSIPTKASLEYELATTFMDVVPKAMREIRINLRSSRGPDLSVPQFRVLIKLRKEPCTINELAEHIGLSVAAMSRMVQGLVTKGLLIKTCDTKDRRKTYVDLSKKGRTTINHIREAGCQELAETMKQLNFQEKKDLQAGFAVLKKLFTV